MTEYQAPLDDMRFVLNELADLDAVAQLPGFEEVTPDLVDAILEQAGKLGAEVLAPLNRSGDIEGCQLENGVVRTPKGFPEAYVQFIEGGWNGVPFDPDYGGQGLPYLVTTAVYEIWHAANMALALCPTLTQAAVELLSVHGSDGLKAVFMEKLVSGVWTGTMNLTESQAGSDLSQIRTQAVREGERYLITGQKIFISHGEHTAPWATATTSGAYRSNTRWGSTPAPPASCPSATTAAPKHTWSARKTGGLNTCSR